MKEKSRKRPFNWRALLTAVAFACCSNMAAENVITLVVQKTDGGTESFALADKPEISINGANCVFSCGDNSVSIARTDITEFHFEEVSTAIAAPKSGDTSLRFGADNTVIINGVETSGISVYDLGGRKVNAQTTRNGQETTVSLDGQPKGVYIIKYGNNTIKTTRK